MELQDMTEEEIEAAIESGDVERGPDGEPRVVPWESYP
jgi:hypothetical protein